jgi:predicted CoA-binding protein
MPAQDLSLDSIEDFLAQRRIAMVGISRQPGSFSVQLFKELSRRGYDVVPVNPKTSNIQGRRCFAHVQDIEPPVEAALLMTSPEGTDAVVSDCAEAGIRAFGCIGQRGEELSATRQSSFAGSTGFASLPESVRACFCPRAKVFIAFTGSSAGSQAAIPGTFTELHD